MIKPLSWSEMSKFLENRNEWYKNYILGIKDPPSPQQIRGSYLHRSCFANKLEDSKYFPDEQRINANIVKEFSKIVGFKGWEWECKATIDISGVPTLAYWDGYNHDEHSILEFKTGASLWNEEKMQNHGQTILYSLQNKLINGNVPIIKFVSASTKSGKVISQDFIVPDITLAQMQNDIIEVWNEMGKYRELRTSSK